MDRLASLRFETAEIADAIGVDMGNIKSWVDRGLIAPTKAAGAKSGHGCPRQYTLSTVYEAAIIARLGTHGISSKLASKMAAEFTSKGNSGRVPGEIFQTGKTWIVAIPAKTRIVNTQPCDSIADLLDEINTGELTRSAIIIDLSRLIEDLDSKLNITNFKEQPPTFNMPGVGTIEFK